MSIAKKPKIEPVSHVSRRSLPLFGNGIQDELEFLFAEVGALATRLRQTARQVHRQDSLPSGARAILQALEQRGEQTVPELARARATSRQNIQVLADRLADADYVEFISNPAHQRSDLIRLTARGQAVLGSANEREAALLAQLLPHTTEAEVLSAAALLQRLRHLLSERVRKDFARTEKSKAGQARLRKQGSERPLQKNISFAEMAAELPLADPTEDELPIALL